MAFVSTGHSPLEMTCGARYVHVAERRCGPFASNLRSLRKIAVCSNVRVANIRKMSLSPKNRNLCSAARMSALGQKRTFAPQNLMSALPPKADMCGATRDVRFGPKADSCSATKMVVIRSPRRRE
jgi:hypothetical protein